jgi:hypothetical protein
MLLELILSLSTMVQFTAVIDTNMDMHRLKYGYE